MPCAYQIYAVDRFPKDKHLKTEEQLTLEYNSQHDLEPSSTKLDFVAEVGDKLLKYDVEHDFLFQLEFYGRVKGMYFREFVTPYKFPIFRGQHEPAVGFAPLLARTKKKVAADFVSRLNRKLPVFDARPVRVDFEKLRPRLQFIRGAWFARMRQPNLSSTAVFGANVDQSDEFRHAELFGQLTNLMVEVEHEGVTHTVMFGADGTIVPYQNYQTESDELRIVQTLMVGLLEGCIAVRDQERGG